MSLWKLVSVGKVGNQSEKLLTHFIEYFRY